MTAPTVGRARPGTIWHNGRGEGWIAECSRCIFFLERQTTRDAWTHKLPLGGRRCPQ